MSMSLEDLNQVIHDLKTAAQTSHPGLEMKRVLEIEALKQEYEKNEENLYPCLQSLMCDLIAAINTNRLDIVKLFNPIISGCNENIFEFEGLTLKSDNQDTITFLLTLPGIKKTLGRKENGDKIFYTLLNHAISVKSLKMIQALLETDNLSFILYGEGCSPIKYEESIQSAATRNCDAIVYCLLVKVKHLNLSLASQSNLEDYPHYGRPLFQNDSIVLPDRTPMSHDAFLKAYKQIMPLEIPAIHSEQLKDQSHPTVRFSATTSSASGVCSSPGVIGSDSSVCSSGDGKAPVISIPVQEAADVAAPPSKRNKIDN